MLEQVEAMPEAQIRQNLGVALEAMGQPVQMVRPELPLYMAQEGVAVVEASTSSMYSTTPLLVEQQTHTPLVEAARQGLMVSNKQRSEALRDQEVVATLMVYQGPVGD